MQCPSFVPQLGSATGKAPKVCAPSLSTSKLGYVWRWLATGEGSLTATTCNLNGGAVSLGKVLGAITGTCLLKHSWSGQANTWRCMCSAQGMKSKPRALLALAACLSDRTALLTCSGQDTILGVYWSNTPDSTLTAELNCVL